MIIGCWYASRPRDLTQFWWIEYKNILRNVVWSEAENLWSGIPTICAVTSLLYDTVVLNFVVKTVREKTDSCRRLRRLCVFLSFHVPRLSLVNSVSLYLLFLRVSRGGSSYLSELSRLLFVSTGTSLREPEHDVDGVDDCKPLPVKALGRAASLL